MDIRIKIRKVSIALQFACYLAIAVSLLTLLYVCWLYQTAPTDLFSHYFEESQGLFEYFNMLPRFWSLIITVFLLLPTLLLFSGLWRLSKAFSLFNKSLYFTSKAANHLFAFAVLATFTQLLGSPLLITALLISELGTGLNAPELSIEFNPNNLFSLIISVSFILISWIIREGARLQDENREFI